MAAESLSIILSFPPPNVTKLTAKKYDEEIKNYIKELVKVPMATYIKPLDKRNILEYLNPEINSIPYIYALLAQKEGLGKDTARHEALLNQCSVLFAMFDPIQIRYIGKEWTTLLLWVLETLPRLGITDYSTITTAMLRLDPTGGTFTSTHLRLLRACLEAGVPSQALPILDKNIYAFPTNSRKEVAEDLPSEEVEFSNGFITPKSCFTLKIEPEWVMEYYLLGAGVYIGKKKFSRARLFLEYVLLHPSNHHSTSAFQVEAYKKWIMVGLLSQGRAFPLPRTHDTSVMKSIRAIAKPYDALAECFEKRDWRKYQAEMDVGMQIWHDDGNLRLVREAAHTLVRYRVMDLERTYAALPVGKVAAHLDLQPEATLPYLAEVIQSGHLRASVIAAQDGSAAHAVLRFHDSKTTATSLVYDDLESQTRRIQELVSFVREADRRLQLTKEYVEYQKRQKRTGPDADLADQMDLTWDAGPPTLSVGDGDEEDIMAA